jgi:hypothetical protein
MTEPILEIECPACGEPLSIYEVGYTQCKCGEAVAELTVNWETIEQGSDDGLYG